MIKSYDKCVGINHNSNCSCILDHPCRILIIGGPRSAETILLLSLIKNPRPDIEKNIYTSKIHSNLSINCLLMEDPEKSKSIH